MAPSGAPQFGARARDKRAVKRSLRMFPGCLRPLSAVFLLSLLGSGGGVTLCAFIVLMFGCHLFMTGHRARHEVEEGRTDHSKGDDHANA